MLDCTRVKLVFGTKAAVIYPKVHSDGPPVRHKSDDVIMILQKLVATPVSYVELRSQIHLFTWCVRFGKTPHPYY